MGTHRPRSDPGNLGRVWVGSNFAAFGLPVRIINDAAMQALGIYEGARMLFLGLASTFIRTTSLSRSNWSSFDPRRI